MQSYQSQSRHCQSYCKFHFKMLCFQILKLLKCLQNAAGEDFLLYRHLKVENFILKYKYIKNILDSYCYFIVFRPFLHCAEPDPGSVIFLRIRLRFQLRPKASKKCNLRIRFSRSGSGSETLLL